MQGKINNLWNIVKGYVTEYGKKKKIENDKNREEFYIFLAQNYSEGLYLSTLSTLDSS